MTREEALNTLRRVESDLRARGVAHVALFGSLARGDNRPDSDVDVLVEFDPGAQVTVFDYLGVRDYIESLFSQRVDVIDREVLKPHLRRPTARIQSMRSDAERNAIRDILHQIDLAQNFTRGRINRRSVLISCGCTQSRVA